MKNRTQKEAKTQSAKEGEKWSYFPLKRVSVVRRQCTARAAVKSPRGKLWSAPIIWRHRARRKAEIAGGVRRMARETDFSDLIRIYALRL